MEQWRSDVKERYAQYQSADCRMSGFQSCSLQVVSGRLHEEWPLGKLLCPSLITLATPSHRTPLVMLSYFCNGASESLIFSARCGDNQEQKIRTENSPALRRGSIARRSWGRGRPTPSLIASVRTPVMSTENRSPAQPPHVNRTHKSEEPAEEQLKKLMARGPRPKSLPRMAWCMSYTFLLFRYTPTKTMIGPITAYICAV